MKKTLLLFAIALIGGVASAQTTENSLQFVDKNGNPIADGATVKGIAEYVDMGDLGGYYEVNCGLSIKNNSSEDIGASLNGKIVSIDNGSFQCCFPQQCLNPLTMPGAFSTDADAIEAGETRSLIIHWDPLEYGTCKVKMQILVYDVEFDRYGRPTDYTLRGNGPSVTVDFVYDETTSNIESVRVEPDAKIDAYYSLDGQLLSKPQKGINIIKYSTGRTAKIFVK